MSIKLMLPRKATGREILDAFRSAATFQESPVFRWETSDYTVSSRDSEKKEPSEKHGCYATPTHQGILSRFFRRWRQPLWKANGGMESRFMTQVQLLPLFLNEAYSEVFLEVHHEYDLNVGGGFKIANVPDDPGFVPFKPAYDRMVRDLLQNLC